MKNNLSLLLLYLNNLIGCDLNLSNPSTSLNLINNLMECLNINSINLQGLNNFESIDITICSSSSSIEQCENTLQEHIKEHPNSIFSQIALKLLNTPQTTCPCIKNVSPNLSNCITNIDNLLSYCNLIENNLNNIQTETQQCTQKLQNICPLINPTLEESLSCLQAHVTELEGSCSIPLNSMLANIYSDCESDISLYCESNYVASCLQDNYEKLSTECQTQVILIILFIII